MSGDEVLVLMVSLAIALVAWTRWYLGIALVRTLASPHALRAPLYLAPPVAGLAVLAVLTTLAAHDVRDAPAYIGFYLAFGAAWTGVAIVCQRLCGLHARDDAADRGNAGAAVACAGAVLGSAACYAGANIGDGPGWWCVAVAGGLATLAWFAGWRVLEATTRIGETISIERDTAAGVRLAAFLVALGVICGRGAAGDWTSASATVAEFAAAWPALVLLAVAIPLESRLRSTVARPRSPTASAPLAAAIYLGVAVAGLVAVGVPVADAAHRPPEMAR